MADHLKLDVRWVDSPIALQMKPFELRVVLLIMLDCARFEREGEFNAKVFARAWRRYGLTKRVLHRLIEIGAVEEIQGSDRYTHRLTFFNQYCDYRVTRKEQWRRASVYAVRNTGDGLVKIGASSDPDKRISGLQTGIGWPLEVIAIGDGGYQRESELHAAYAHRRRNGEWFALTDEEVASLKTALQREAA